MDKKEKPIVIELYELWNNIKARLQIVSPQPRSFTLLKDVRPVLSIDGFAIKMINLSDSTQVNSGGGEHVMTLRPPVGKIYQVIGIRYAASAPIGDTAGTHRMIIRSADGVIWIEHCEIKSNHSTGVQVYRGEYDGSASELPADGISQVQQQYHALFAGYDVWLEFYYSNQTDAHQTGLRSLYVLVKESNEGV